MGIAGGLAKDRFNQYQANNIISNTPTLAAAATQAVKGPLGLKAEANSSKERTFIMIKPDGVQRGLIGDIIKRFEQKGFKMCGMKFMQASEDHMKKHYEDLADKPFYPGLVKYMSSAPLCAMCWEGTQVVKTARNM